MKKVEELLSAREEIKETMKLCNFFIRHIGLSFVDEIPTTVFDKMREYLTFIIATFLLILKVLGEVGSAAVQIMKAVTIESVIGTKLHIVGYGSMSFGKMLTIWYERNTFRKLVHDLADIWPISIEDKEALKIKRNSLSSLKIRQILYTLWTSLGLSFYILTPLALFVYNKIIGVHKSLGFIWPIKYPFDTSNIIIHAMILVFESVSGGVSVCFMLGSDLLFMAMASHISMLLRLLQQQIRRLGNSVDDDTTAAHGTAYIDCYRDIVAVIKIHQNLIRYINDLEDAFSVVNLINVLLSSVNICFVMFNIVFLDPWMELSNKFFLAAVLTETGIVCWYADDISQASIGVSDAMYESGWYKSNPSCRRMMLVLLQRSQKPLCFTACKFKPITMITYSSILTTAYSYFTLLYSSYSGN